jgi:hypothetical protein
MALTKKGQLEAMPGFSESLARKRFFYFNTASILHYFPEKMFGCLSIVILDP